MYMFGLSPIRTKLQSNLADIMMCARAVGIMKAKQVEIEAVAAKEMERLGLTPVGSQEGTVENIVMCQRLAQVEDEPKKLKNFGETSSSQGPPTARLKADLEKAQQLLAMQQQKSVEQANRLSQIEAQLKTYGRKLELASKRKQRIIADLELKNQEARQSAEKLKNAESLLVAEHESRLAKEAELQDQAKHLEEELEASRAALKIYQEAEPGRFTVLRQQYLRSDQFLEKATSRIVRSFELAINVTLC
ncbi:M protein, serotype 49-like [Zingiber officinale]|uniref:M protein, serotype 49-like n=1 Tax=Zingiber officinale TaxID=94328 RepID=UPI001C4DD835|nr:M protein, serotype 49-like [Zingiber officinale]